MKWIFYKIKVGYQQEINQRIDSGKMGQGTQDLQIQNKETLCVSAIKVQTYIISAKKYKLDV